MSGKPLAPQLKKLGFFGGFALSGELDFVWFSHGTRLVPG
jgi:hypothetical protein